MKILVADDDRDQLFVRSLLLRKNGFEAIEAGDGPSALRKAKAHKPECALIDLRLPTEECGLELIRALKALDSKMHVFVLTGADRNRLAARKENDLVEEVFVKGAASRDLIEKLNALAAARCPDAPVPRPT